MSEQLSSVMNLRSRNQHGAMKGNERVSCPHCSKPMKRKRLDHHISVHHPHLSSREKEAQAVA